MSSSTRDDLLIAAPGIYTASDNDEDYSGMIEVLFSSQFGLTDAGPQTFRCEIVKTGCGSGDLGESVA